MNLMLINVSTRKFRRAVRLPGCAILPKIRGLREPISQRELPFRPLQWHYAAEQDIPLTFQARALTTTVYAIG
jgi:hypothetical protein